MSFLPPSRPPKSWGESQLPPSNREPNVPNDSEYPAAPQPPEEEAPPQVETGARMVRVQLPRRKPWVTYTILGLTILVYLLQVASQYLLGQDLPLIFGAKYTPAILDGELWRLITPALLHASPAHIAFNMYALYSIGPGLELYYGAKRYLALYIVGALGGCVASFLFSDSISVGASGAIFGLVAAEGIFIYRNRFLFGQQTRSMLINIGTILVINLLLGMMPNIDNWGHLGGLLAGLGFAWFSGPLMHVIETPEGFTLADQREEQAILLGGSMTYLAVLFAAFVRFMTH